MQQALFLQTCIYLSFMGWFLTAAFLKESIGLKFVCVSSIEW
jgi:hypothetical protein